MIRVRFFTHVHIFQTFPDEHAFCNERKKKSISFQFFKWLKTSKAMECKIRTLNGPDQVGLGGGTWGFSRARLRRDARGQGAQASPEKKQQGK